MSVRRDVLGGGKKEKAMKAPKPTSLVRLSDRKPSPSQSEARGAELRALRLGRPTQLDWKGPKSDRWIQAVLWGKYVFKVDWLLPLSSTLFFSSSIFFWGGDCNKQIGFGWHGQVTRAFAQLPSGCLGCSEFGPATLRADKRIDRI